MTGIDDFLHRVLAVVLLGCGLSGNDYRRYHDSGQQPAEAEKSSQKLEAHDVIHSSLSGALAFDAFCADRLNNRFTKYGVIMAASTVANFAQF
jgi:hypothetical protein